MKYLYLFLIPLIFFSCNKDDFDTEHSQHIVGKWRWVKTDYVTYDLFDTYSSIFTPETSDRKIEIEFKKNGTSKFYINDKLYLRYLDRLTVDYRYSLFTYEKENPYYFISTRINKEINCSEHFQYYIPVNAPDSLYSSFGICPPKFGYSRSVYIRIK
jgi:hypothetical protein